MLKSYLKFFFCSLLSIFVLTGCFGDGDDTSSTPTGSSSITLSGATYDAPVPNATVTIKAVKSDGTEITLATTTADSSGNWTANIDPANIPDDATLMAEVNGTLNGKDVKFNSILGKGSNIKDKGSDGEVTTDEVPELITSNVSTVDYVLSLLQKGGDVTKLVDDPEVVLAAVKAQKLEVRKKMAAAIKAYLDKGATLNINDTDVEEDSLTGLLKALVKKSMDGELDSTEIKEIFGTDDFYEVYEAEHEIMHDNTLKTVFTKGSAASDISPQELYNDLVNNIFYWKDVPYFYRKLTFDENGNVQVAFYFNDETSGNWTEISPSEYQTYGLDYDPANWLEKLDYDQNEGKLYLVTKTGEKFEISLLEKSNEAYTLLLTNVSLSPNWDALLTYQQSSNIPLVMAYGINSYTSIEDFRSAFSNCTVTFDNTGAITTSGCLMGGLQLSDNGTVEVVEPSLESTSTTTFPIGKWEIDNNVSPAILKITFYDPEGTGKGDQIKGSMIFALYSSSDMGDHTGTTLMNIDPSSPTTSTTVSLTEGIPIMFFSVDTIKLPLFTNEQAVQNFMPPQFAIIEALKDTSMSGELPQEAKDMLCAIDSTDQPSAIIDCSSSSIIITINSTDYTVDNTGVLEENGTYCGHLMEITPFSFTVCWGNSPTSCSSTTTYVNTTKQTNIVDGMF